MSTCRMATTPCSIPSINTRSTELTSSITRVIRSPVARLSNHRSGSSWMCEYKSLRKSKITFCSNVLFRIMRSALNPCWRRNAIAASAMKTPSGTFALKLVILAAGVTASIVLISACLKASLLTGGDPILMIFDADGVKTRASSEDVAKAFDDLIGKHGKDVCNVDYYDKDHPHLG